MKELKSEPNKLYPHLVFNSGLQEAFEGDVKTVFSPWYGHKQNKFGINKLGVIGTFVRRLLSSATFKRLAMTSSRPVLRLVKQRCYGGSHLEY